MYNQITQYTFICACTTRFLYEGDVVIVLDNGRVTQFGHPRKVLPLVEEQLQSTRDMKEEEEQRVGL